MNLATPSFGDVAGFKTAMSVCLISIYIKKSICYCDAHVRILSVGMMEAHTIESSILAIDLKNTRWHSKEYINNNDGYF